MGKKPKFKYRVLCLAETPPTVHSSSENSSAVTSTSNISVSAVGPKNDSMESSSSRFKSEVTAERNTEEDISNAERPSIDESASCSMPKDNYQLSNSSGRRASLKSDNYGDDSPSQSKDERRHNDQKRNESKDPERDYNTRSSRNTEEDISNAERPSIDESASWSKAKDNYQCSNSSGRRASLKSDNNGDDSSSQSRDERRHSDRRPNDNTRSSRNKCFKEDISNSERPSRNKDGKTGDGKDANKSQRQKSPYQKLPKNDFSPIVDSVKNKVERVGKAVFEFIDGDLFHTADDFSLAHCVGEDMAMGAGIAVAFRKKFHKVGFLLDQQVKTGGVAVLEAPPRFVYYLVTKRLSTGKPTMSSLKSSVEKMKDHIVKNGVQKLALPELGSGKYWLDWDSVLEFLKKLFSDVEIHIQIYHYVPDDASTLDDTYVTTEEQVEGSSSVTKPTKPEDERACNIKGKKKPGKRTLDDRDALLMRKATHILSQDDDEYDIFGNYIASQIRTTKTEYLRKKMKRKIQRAVLEVTEEEEEMIRSGMYSSPSLASPCETDSTLSNEVDIQIEYQPHSIVHYIENETDSCETEPTDL